MTSRCTATEAKPYREWTRGVDIFACDACITELRAIGMDLRDARPEWVRRAEARKLPAKVLAL